MLGLCRCIVAKGMDTKEAFCGIKVLIRLLHVWTKASSFIHHMLKGRE